MHLCFHFKVGRNTTHRRCGTNRDGEVKRDIRLYTVEDVQRRLSISRTKAYELCTREIPTVRIGRSVRVRKEDLDHFIEKHRH